MFGWRSPVADLKSANEFAERNARRMAALANQGSQSIAYMQAQAMLNISEGIKNGKVQTIVVPSNFTALMTK